MWPSLQFTSWQVDPATAFCLLDFLNFLNMNWTPVPCVSQTAENKYKALWANLKLCSLGFKSEERIAYLSLTEVKVGLTAQLSLQDDFYLYLHPLISSAPLYLHNLLHMLAMRVFTNPVLVYFTTLFYKFPRWSKTGSPNQGIWIFRMHKIFQGVHEH